MKRLESRWRLGVGGIFMLTLANKNYIIFYMTIMVFPSAAFMVMPASLMKERRKKYEIYDW